jgi:hypothetical protein
MTLSLHVDNSIDGTSVSLEHLQQFAKIQLVLFFIFFCKNAENAPLTVWRRT